MQFVSWAGAAWQSDTVWAKVKHDGNEFHASNENPDQTIWRCSYALQSVFQLARNKTDGPDMIWIILP